MVFDDDFINWNVVMSLKPDLKTQRQGGIDHKRMITILKTLGGKKKKLERNLRAKANR